MNKKEKEADAEQRSGYRGILPLKCRLDVVLELAAERLRCALAYLTKLWVLIGSAFVPVPVIRSRDTEIPLSIKFGSDSLPLSSSLIQGLLLSSGWFALHISMLMPQTIRSLASKYPRVRLSDGAVTESTRAAVYMLLDLVSYRWRHISPRRIYILLSIAT